MSDNSDIKSAQILGGGAWGGAISVLLAQNIEKVMIYYRNKKALNSHKDFTSLINIYKKSQICYADLYIIAVPSVEFVEVIGQLKHGVKNLYKKNILIATKGLEPETGCLLSEVVLKEIKEANIAVLSGPNFAKEVALGKYTTSLIASSNLEYAKSVGHVLNTSNFKLYYSTDIIGIQIAGAIKNIVAIAAGIVRGLNLGENTVASIISQGMKEISMLAIAMGSDNSFILTPAGIGDLFLTCSSLTSRNSNFGYKIGKGDKVEELSRTDTNNNTTIEGIAAVKTVKALAEKLNLNLDIINTVYNIIEHHHNPYKAIIKLFH